MPIKEPSTYIRKRFVGSDLKMGTGWTGTSTTFQQCQLILKFEFTCKTVYSSSRSRSPDRVRNETCRA